MEILSFIIGGISFAIPAYFVGFFVDIYKNAAGKYFADKASRTAIKSEDEKELQSLFDSVCKKMPKLIKEMAQDIKRDSLSRGFYVHDYKFHSMYETLETSNIRVYYTCSDVNGPKDETIHEHLVDKMNLLEEYGFVVDDGYLLDYSNASTHKVSRGRMTDKFVRLLSSYNFSV